MAQTFHRYRAGDKPVGGYRLIRKLGEGGFGEVWQASAPGGAEVALKFIDLTGQQGFREFKSLRLVKKITHNNLTPLHGFWLKNEDGTLIDESDVTWSQLAPSFPVDPATAPSATMATAVFTHPVELIVAMGLGKQSLYDRLRECKDQGQGGIPADELLDYMEDAAKGIDYLNKPMHNMGQGPVPIVHSDVKPHNILVVGDGAQVCDFGLAHAVESLRKTCQAPLTLAYAAPESFRGKPCDKSDQYSLAITYIELRTGCLPFDDTMTGYEVMTAHVQGLLDLSRLTQSEAAVIKRATASLPQDRWRSCREMIIELRRALRLSTDSNYMVEGLTDAPGPNRLSGPTPPPDRARGTMMAPNFGSGETSPFSGPTPSDVDPALRTRTPSSVTPVVVPGQVEYRPAAQPRRFSTGAKLLASIVLLGICATGGYAIWGPWRDGLRDGNGNGKNNSEVTITKTGDAHTDFDKLMEAKQFASALDLLQEPAFDASQIEQKRGEVQTAWRQHADDAFRSGVYETAYQDYAEMVDRFSTSPDANDFKLMQARSRLGLDDFKGAGQAIGGISPPQTRTSSRDRIFFVVQIITEVNGDKKLDKLVALHTVWKENRDRIASQSSPNNGDIWTITKDEIEHLKDARSAVIGNWLQTGLKLKESDLTTIDAILEIDPDNADAWIAKADLHSEFGPPAQFEEAMKRRASLTNRPRIAQLVQRARLLDTYFALTSPSASDERVTAALSAVPNLLTSFKDRRAALASSVRELANRDQRYLAPAVEALREAAEATDADATLKQQFAALLALEIPRRLSKESNFEQAAPQFQADCGFVIANSSGAGIPDNVLEVVRACQAECMLVLRNGDPKEVIGSSGSHPYFHYVRARVYSGPRGDREKVDASLKELFDKNRHPILDLAERSQKAIALVDQVADAARGATRTFKVETLLTNPVDLTLQARDTYELLRNAHQWTQPSLLATDSRANLAIAAWWIPAQSKAADDKALAKELTLAVGRDWIKNKSSASSDNQLAFSLFHTLLASHADANDETVEGLRIEAAREMIKLASSSALDDKDTAALYATAVRPIEELAKRHRSADFFAEAARLIAANPTRNWNFTTANNRSSVDEKLEDLYTLAIDASGGKDGKYFKLRGDVRTRRQPPVYDAVLRDATELKRFDEYKAQAFALEGHMRYLRSRDGQVTTTHADRIKELKLAYKALHDAEQLAKDTGKLPTEDLATLWLILSYIHTERGNYAGLFDNEKIVPKDEFGNAILYAEKVINEGGGPSLQYAYEAAANGYEDLAWYAQIDKEKNFAKAIGHLTNSIAVNGNSPDPHMALARSYYKMVVEMKPPVNPPELGTNIAGHLKAARTLLGKAISLAGDGKKPEAHLWLAKVIQASHVDDRTPLEKAQTLLTPNEYREADEQFTKALLAATAKDARISDVYRVTYAIASTEHALLNPDLNLDSGNAKTKAVNSVYERANQLGKLENGRTAQIDPVQEAKLFRARADLKGKTASDKVIASLENDAKSISSKPAAELTRSDGKLVEFRIELAARLRPDQLSKQVVKSAVDDAIWYSKAPSAVVRQSQRDEALFTAIKLNQQIAVKGAANLATWEEQAAGCLQRYIDLNFPADDSLPIHMKILAKCAETVKSAAATKSIATRLHEVTKAYLADAIKKAEKGRAAAANANERSRYDVTIAQLKLFQGKLVGQ